ncbi:MAG: rRNA maturation RNase YbeY [Bacteroidetes bacterium]|nr:rRNA maturation RNase YbeY [Bacteroidota bacterium]
MIQFSNQEIRYTLKNKLKVREWVKSIFTGEQKKMGDLSYIFCSDDYLHALNVQYLKHDTLTDIITFDYNEAEKVCGDIFISLERVKENAAKYSRSMDEELGRVMAHGALHLLGYKDKSPADKNKMREKENQYLVSYPNL